MTKGEFRSMKNDLAGSYRPHSLSEVVGQEIVVRTLTNAFKNNNLHQSYLFVGQFGSGKCVTGNTRIITPSGIRQIRDIVGENDGFIERSSRVFNGVINSYVDGSHVFSQLSPTVRVATNEGFDIEGTPEHPVLVFDEHSLKPQWKTLGTMKVGDYLCISRTPVVFGDHVSPDLVFILAALTAEGNWDGKYFHFTNKNESMLQKFVSAVQNEFDYTCSSVLDKRTGCSRLSICSIYISNQLREMGLSDGLSIAKSVPTKILNSDIESRKLFLNYYWEFDGSVGKTALEFTSASEQLSKELHLLLLVTLGVVSTIRPMFKSATNGKQIQRLYYSVTVYPSEFKKIQRAISDTDVSGLKISNLLLWDTEDSNPNIDIVPYLKQSFVELKKYLPISKNGKLMIDGQGVAKIASPGNCIPSNTANASFRKVQEIFNYCKELLYAAESADNTAGYCKWYSDLSVFAARCKEIIEQSWFYSKITEVKHIPLEKRVYDLHIPYYHSFWSNGLTSHNTTAARILAAMENCLRPNGIDPCCSCKICKDIFNGTHTDVVEIDAASAAGKVDQVRQLKTDAMYNPIDAKKKYFIIDECLGYRSRVETDQGLIPIGRIVNEKLPCKVKSYNETTNQFEFRPILNWFKNSKKNVYKIGFESRGRLYACDNHQIYTPGGQKKVSDLDVGDTVLREELSLSTFQEQVLYGCLLGDANICKNERTGKKRKIETSARIRFVHGAPQHKYLDYKYEILRDFVSSGPKVRKNLGFGDETWWFNTVTSPQFTRLWNLFVCNGQKHVSHQLLKRLDWPAIAFWFCDDGSCYKHVTVNSKNRYYINFATHGFTYDDCNKLAGWLKDHFIDCEVKTDNRGKGHYIYVGPNSSEKLLSRISVYIPDCMSYKLAGFADHSKQDPKYIDREPKKKLIPQKICTKEFYKEENSTYDIEVEHNHNYFVSGTLVHNCHRMSAESNDALLKLIEEPPAHCRFILCTTDIQKVKPTVLSRCQRHDFRKIYWSKIGERLELIAKDEKIDVDMASLNLCAKMSGGSMRTALQYLEKLASYGNGKITLEDTQKMFGSAGEMAYFDLIDNIIGDNSGSADATAGYRIITSILATGADFTQLYSDIADHLRSLMVGLTSSQAGEFVFLSEEGKKRLQAQLNAIKQRGSIEGVLESINKLNNARIAVDVNLPPETALQLWFLESVFAMRKPR